MSKIKQKCVVKGCTHMQKSMGKRGYWSKCGKHRKEQKQKRLINQSSPQIE